MDGTPVAAQQFEDWNHEQFRRSENGLEITKKLGSGLCPYYTAVWGQPLSGGRPGSGGVGRKHLSVFTVVHAAKTSMLFGIVAVGYDVQTRIDAHDDYGHCFYSTGNGKKFPGWEDWEGEESAKQGDQIALLLDRDVGSMAVYKNDRLLGVMQAEGLSGDYRWAVIASHRDSSARVECLPPRHYIELEAAKEKARKAEELKEKERQKMLQWRQREQQQQQRKEEEEKAKLERAEAALARLEGKNLAGGAE